LPYKTGTKVTYSLVPTTNSVLPFLMRIVGASYGDDTTDVSIAADGLSVTITVQSGPDNLVAAVATPSREDEGALVEAGVAIPRFLFDPDWGDHGDACKLEITGT